MDRSIPIVSTTTDLLCAQCGCRVPREGQTQHEAWHDFVNSGIAELVTAALESDDPE